MKKRYLVEYYDPNTDVLTTTKVEGEDKTEARDTFFKLFPRVNYLERITWIPEVNNKRGGS